MRKTDKKMRLSTEDFSRSFELVPRVAVDLLIMRETQLVLTRRKKEPLKGWWHIPGSFLMKGEKLSQCVERIAREELGVKVKRIEFVGVHENLRGDPRGHVIDVVYKCGTEDEVRAVGDTAEVGWFDRIPEKFGFGQEQILRDVGFN